VLWFIAPAVFLTALLHPALVRRLDVAAMFVWIAAALVGLVSTIAWAENARRLLARAHGPVTWWILVAASVANLALMVVLVKKLY
ncbi:MAG TPA: hypothetical protein VG797_01020, partial [Phycisphaerales bacterium]|nr:hypothetical protein [Phycisphaerales bacterium]